MKRQFELLSNLVQMRMLKTKTRRLHFITRVFLSHTSIRIVHFPSEFRIFPINFPGQEDTVRALIALGAKVNAENAKKETPLHLATLRGKTSAPPSDCVFTFNRFPFIILFQDVKK